MLRNYIRKQNWNLQMMYILRIPYLSYIEYTKVNCVSEKNALYIRKPILHTRFVY